MDTQKSPYSNAAEGCNQVGREDVVPSIRRKARQLREQSVQLDRLADELSRFSFSQDAEAALYMMFLR